MKCGFDYCIYNDKFCCILEEINVNAWGVCDECIIVTITEEELKILKEKQLTKLP